MGSYRSATHFCSDIHDLQILQISPHRCKYLHKMKWQCSGDFRKRFWKTNIYPWENINLCYEAYSGLQHLCLPLFNKHTRTNMDINPNLWSLMANMYAQYDLVAPILLNSCVLFSHSSFGHSLAFSSLRSLVFKGIRFIQSSATFSNWHCYLWGINVNTDRLELFCCHEFHTYLSLTDSTEKYWKWFGLKFWYPQNPQITGSYQAYNRPRTFPTVNSKLPSKF